MLRDEDDLISDIAENISSLTLETLLQESYPLFDFDGKKWFRIKNDNEEWRDEMLIAANEVLNEP